MVLVNLETPADPHLDFEMWEAMNPDSRASPVLAPETRESMNPIAAETPQLPSGAPPR